MRTNVKTVSPRERTHGGALAVNMNDEQALRRSVLAHFLWEKEFYEEGETITDRIKSLVPKVRPEKVSELAVEARRQMKLRHVPLFLTREMCRHATHRPFVGQTLAQVVERPDEMGEFLSLYWKDQKNAPLAAQVKKGLSTAFGKFDKYQLSKYDREAAVKLRDVMFLTCPKPSKEMESVYKKLADRQLESADTWEVSLSAGDGVKSEDGKKDRWERLLNERKLGALALLRNLRNMQTAGVAEELIRDGLQHMKVERVLPFRFITAAKYAPRLESALEGAMFRCLEGMPKLPGKTVMILDVSGSMSAHLSANSEMNRLESAFALAMLARETCEDVQVYATAGNDSSRVHATALVPPRRGFGLVAALREKVSALGGGGIFLKQVMDYTLQKEKTAERVIVFTDEQDCDYKCDPKTAVTYGKYNYIVNIASARNGIGYGKWTHMDGFSEHVLSYIYQAESSNAIPQNALFLKQ